MSISVYCQWCGTANNTAGRCTDMMCRGGDVRPAVVEVGTDPRDAEIKRMCEERDSAQRCIEKLTAEVKATRDHDQRLVDQLHDAGGALDDAGVSRHEDDEIASGIEKLAKDRDELLDQWIKVGNLFWPNREPDDGWSADEVADEVRALRARVAALEAVVLAARSEIAYMDETKAAHPDALVEPTLNELRAALAAVEVQK